jgi:hypothetical protein
LKRKKRKTEGRKEGRKEGSDRVIMLPFCELVAILSSGLTS